MDRLQIARREIPDMGLDDYTGLYEIIWRFDTLWPDMDIGKKYQLADEALRELLSQNTVRIITRRSDNNLREYEPTGRRQIDEVLRNPVNWYPAAPEEPWSQFGYETTDIGEALHNEFYRLRIAVDQDNEPASVTC